MNDEMKILFSDEKDGSVKILFVDPALLSCGQNLKIDFTGWTNLDFHYRPSTLSIARSQFVAKENAS